uniref:Uncharacterized protein n=1 Tax=Ciona savignyi TaxID=51511 RepID=H2YRV8_CIOSA
MSTGLKHPQQHPRSVKVDILAARKSNTGPRGGKPSPTNTVANVYLSAVENGGENRGGAILRHPKEKAVESAVRAARVTGNSNKR